MLQTISKLRLGLLVITDHNAITVLDAGLVYQRRSSVLRKSEAYTTVNQ